jgi:hypothetical protein
MFEAGPEPTMIYAFTGKFNGGDFIGNLIGKQFHVSNAPSRPSVAKPFGGVIPDLRNRERGNQLPAMQNKGGRPPKNGMNFQNRPNKDGYYERVDRDDDWENRVDELRNIVEGKK